MYEFGRNGCRCSARDVVTGVPCGVRSEIAALIAAAHAIVYCGRRLLISPAVNFVLRRPDGLPRAASIRIQCARLRRARVPVPADSVVKKKKKKKKKK